MSQAENELELEICLNKISARAKHFLLRKYLVQALCLVEKQTIFKQKKSFYLECLSLQITPNKLNIFFFTCIFIIHSCKASSKAKLYFYKNLLVYARIVRMYVYSLVICIFFWPNLFCMKLFVFFTRNETLVYTCLQWVTPICHNMLKI